MAGPKKETAHSALDAAQILARIVEHLDSDDRSGDIRPIAVPHAVAAQIVGLPANTLTDYRNRGEIAHVVYGHGTNKQRYLYRVADLEDWLQSRRVPAKREASK